MIIFIFFFISFVYSLLCLSLQLLFSNEIIFKEEKIF